MDNENGHDSNGNGKIYVKFGPHETDEMPIDWASAILTNWREKQPTQFAKYLSAVVTGRR